MSLRLVFTADTHFEFEPDLIPEGDYFYHAGDLMYSGYIAEWEARLRSFDRLRTGRYQKFQEMYYVPGNHDMHVYNFMGPANQDLRRVGVKMLGAHPKHTTMTLPNGMVVLGLPYVTGLYGWGFNMDEDDTIALAHMLPRADIVVSHSPPRIPGMDGKGDWGVKGWNHYQQLHRPKYWINGHIHECYGEYAVNGTIFHNVSMCNRDYKQVNPALVLDV
jgi:hypothetical protein